MEKKCNVSLRGCYGGSDGRNYIIAGYKDADEIECIVGV